MSSSSDHVQPESGFVSIARPGSFRSMAAGLNSATSPAISGLSLGSMGQPWQRTRTGYIRSAAKPRAQKRRVDSTSPKTSALRGPYLTFTSWPGLVSHTNLGEWPLSCFSLYSQVTHSLGANAPFASGPALRSTEGMWVGDQTPARLMASRRSCGVSASPGERLLTWAHPPSARLSPRRTAAPRVAIKGSLWTRGGTGASPCARAGRRPRSRRPPPPTAGCSRLSLSFTSKWMGPMFTLSVFLV